MPSLTTLFSFADSFGQHEYTMTTGYGQTHISLKNKN